MYFKVGSSSGSPEPGAHLMIHFLAPFQLQQAIIEMAAPFLVGVVSLGLLIIDQLCK